MKKGLDIITERTLKLWYEVNRKYGFHVYTLAVNGLNQVVLCKAYTEDLVVGTNTAVQKKLRELLAD